MMFEKPGLPPAEKKETEEIITDYPEDIKKLIEERGNSMEALSEINDVMRTVANTIEEMRKAEGVDANENILEARKIRDAIDAELGLLKISDDERMEGREMMIGHLKRLNPKELSLEALSSAESAEEKKQVKENIIRDEGMINFLERRQN